MVNGNESMNDMRAVKGVSVGFKQDMVRLGLSVCALSMLTLGLVGCSSTGSVSESDSHDVTVSASASQKSAGNEDAQSYGAAEGVQVDNAQADGTLDNPCTINPSDEMLGGGDKSTQTGDMAQTSGEAAHPVETAQVAQNTDVPQAANTSRAETTGAAHAPVLLEALHTSFVAADDGGYLGIPQAFADDINAKPATAGENAGSSSSDSSAAANAPSDKQEVVYVQMSADGTLNEASVVNTLKGEGVLEDFGAYTTVRNLLDASGVTKEGQRNTVATSVGRASYEGILITSGAPAGITPGQLLPWDISITYTLNGEEISADDLGGQTGELEIRVSIAPSETDSSESFDTLGLDSGSRSEFAQAYVVQSSITLSDEIAQHIEAPDAQITRSGSSTQVVTTTLPGKSATYTITADVENFHMDAIRIAGVPFKQAIESPDTTEMQVGLGELVSGASELSSGASSVSAGITNVSSGIDGLADGIDKTKDATKKLSGGAENLSGGVGELKGGAEGVLDGITQLQSGLYAQAEQAKSQAPTNEFLQNVTAALTQAQQNYLNAYAKGYAEALRKEGTTEAQAQAAAAQSSAQAASAYAQALEQYTKVSGGIAAAEGVSQVLTASADGLGTSDNSSTLLGGANALLSGVTKLSDSSQTFVQGVQDLDKGMKKLQDGAHSLSSGGKQAASGAAQLQSGSKAFHSSVSGLPDEMQQEITQAMESYDTSAFTPRSYIDQRNTNVSLVQFVVTSEPIEVPEADTAEEETPVLSFWERLLALFGL